MKPNDYSRSSAATEPTLAQGALTFCWNVAARIEKAKAAILSEFRDKLDEQQQLLRLALNEAEALAWQTDYPHLFFPALATEKVQALSGWQARQRFLKQSQNRLALAA